MMRPQRTKKPTEKGAEYQKQQQKRHQVKKEIQKTALKKHIEKAKAVAEKVAEKEVEADDYVKVIRDENDKIFKDLHYNNDNIAKKTREVISQYPPNFLPPIFNGLIPLLLEKKPDPVKVQVKLTDLSNGKYQTKTSKSDKSIASGIKTLLKLEGLKQYDKEDLTDFITNHRIVFYNILKVGLEKKHSIATIKGNLVRLVRLLFIAYGNKKNTPIYAKYALIMKALGDRQEEQDDDNILNENEQGRFLRWEYVLQEQQQIEDKFNKISNKKTKEAYNINLNLTLISLYTLTPPLRKEIMTLQFKKQGDDDKNDYVYFKRDETVLNLNRDKKRHGQIDIPLSTHLSNILKQSYQLYPRKYLFTDARLYPNFNKPLAEASVGDRLRKMFIKYGVNIGPSILRSSYTTFRYEEVDDKLPMSEVKKMAKLMRTSPQYLTTSYRKILNNPRILKAIPIKEEDGEDVIIKQEPNDDDDRNNITIIKDDPYKKKNEYLKNKYKKDEEYRNKVLKQQHEYKAKVGKEEIQKRKVISLLRNSEQYRKSIKQTTLDKYGIKIEDIDFKK